MRVLLVDDDRVHNETMQAALQHCPHGSIEADTAESLDQAVRRLAQQHYDAILLDLRLPDANGTAAFQALFRSFTDTPIVVISGEDDERLAYSVIIAGAQDFLVKGQFNCKSLCRAVYYAVARHAYRMIGAELRRVRVKLDDLSDQMAGVHCQGRDLLSLVSELNNCLKPEEVPRV